VAKSYGEHLVFRDVNLVIHRGQRIALVGPNGAGKSTLLKLLAGIEPLSDGDYRVGHNVNREYFAQDQYKELNSERNLFEDLSSIAPRVAQTELRGLLGCFLFSGDDAFKRIGVLSGGERNRYALARILLQPANFLLLDEPTNHLDLRAKDVLLEALQEYTGTVVFVSHDRYFIDKLATRIFEIGSGEVHDYAGNYEDYRAYKEGRQPELSTEVPIAAVHQPERLDGDDLTPKTKRLNPIRLQQMKDRCLEIEEEVARCEAELATYAAELAAFKSGEEALLLSQRIRQCQTNVDQLMKEWEDVAQLIESSQ
jgi:ATP-binding cassette subfamily F protein 3